MSRQRLLMAVLAVSVALNLCVIAGALWSRLNVPAPTTATERFHRLAATLHLDDRQRAAFEAYIDATRTRNAQLRKELDPLLDSAWAEFAQPKPDEAAIMQRINEASSRWRTSQQQMIEATIELLATLDADQRAKFVTDERERRASLRRRHAEEAR